MTRRSTSTRFGEADRKPRTYLVAHPGAEMFGSDRMVLESVRAFIEGGGIVYVALPENGPLVGELVDAGARVVIIPMLVLRKSLMRPSGWMRLIRDASRGLGAAWRLISRLRPDVIYVSTITIPEWPIVARLRHVRAVTHIHEAEASGGRVLNAVLYLPHLVARSVIVNSEFSLDTIRRSLPALGRRSEVVYNGVVGPSSPAAPRAELTDSIRVLYIGRLSPRKGPDLIISAASQLMRDGVASTVTLLGAVFPGYEWYEDQLRAQAADSGMIDSVTFLGFRSDIWPHLADADVLIVPSRLDEPFGNTAVEGVLAHRPVIASDTSGLREAAAGYGSSILVDPDDAAALSTAIATVVESWSEMSAKTAEAAAAAAVRHSPERYRERLRALVR